MAIMLHCLTERLRNHERIILSQVGTIYLIRSTKESLDEGSVLNDWDLK